VRNELLQVARTALGKAGTGPEAAAFWVPGRIEVLGKHTDYAGGRSLVCAVAQGFVAVAVPRPDAVVRVLNVAEGGETWLSLDPDLPTPAVPWCRYPATVVRRLARNFPDARRGLDLAFLSNLPPASGMSSSSAFMVAVFLAVSAVNRLEDSPLYTAEIQSPEALAAYAASIENGRSFGGLTGDRGVGTFGGSEDHTAMLCAREGELSQFAFCPVRRERQVPLPSSWRFVVAVSGVLAEKTGAAKDAYNRASLAVRAILDLWQRASGREDRSLAEAVDRAGTAQVREAIEQSTVDGFTTQALLERFDQFVEESDSIIPSASDAIQNGDWSHLGALVERSQSLAERYLRNQVPETIALARMAREHGAVAASAFGAGFGGSVWALVHADAAPLFARRWQAAYAAAFAERAPGAAFLVTSPGAPAARLP
jgi:galactokinase